MFKKLKLFVKRWENTGKYGGISHLSSDEDSHISYLETNY